MFIKCFCILYLLYHYCNGLLDLISDEYDDFITYGEVVQGWHQLNEIHHVLKEERPFSKVNLDAYEQLTLKWPAVANSNHGEITFLKCTNRTPYSAKIVMHVTEGGTGANSFTLHVMFTPTGQKEKGSWVIICHIYTSKYDKNLNLKYTTPSHENCTSLMDTDIISNITVEYQSMEK